jgi:hypothetical protein
MMKRRATAVGVLALGAALAFIGSAPASSHQLRTGAADPLGGTWQTGLIPVARIRTTLTAHGYTSTQIEHFLHTNNHFVKGVAIRIRFYRENGVPFQIVYAWDPTHNPLPEGDHGPYALLPGDRFTSRGTDPPTDTWRTTYGYSVTATRLRLHFVNLVEPGLSTKQRASDEKRPILMSSTLFKKLS